MTKGFRAALALILAAIPAAVQAHTALRSSNPPSGSVLTQSPPVLTLTFLEPASLTSLTLVTAAGERQLSFTPTGSATTFNAARPGFARGRNEVRWRALSRDGHVVEGSIIVVLRAPKP
ncbi:copper resistance CopC family protein [Sphingomonas sp. TX0543]|uniref:copper resistance CopC family protein n=1 Tax=unclassified Sphingomonas TaxID=196159 RepID=UPI0010F5CA05|nr:copper resistance CopC family protein [Sphingomonas sp. 3P27F8]